MKATLKLITICGGLCLGSTHLAHAQWAVHDPIQTAKTIAEFQKQLQEWSKQHADMGVLNDLTKQVMEYSEELNKFVGDAKEAANKLIEAKNVIDRLAKLQQIDDLEMLEKEIAALTDITAVMEVLDEKKNIYGEVKKEVHGVEIKRDSNEYKRFALTTKRHDAYEKERTTSVNELQAIQEDMAKAVQKAKGAGNQSEQLAILTEIEMLNARLAVLQLRMDIHASDLEAQVLANQDRAALELLSGEDEDRALYEEALRRRKKRTAEYLEERESKRIEHEKEMRSKGLR